MTYAGMVVGGPWAGRQYEWGSGTLNVIESVAHSVPRAEVVDIEQVTTTYAFRRYANGLGFWAPIEWSIERLLAELLAAYKPEVSA